MNANNWDNSPKQPPLTSIHQDLGQITAQSLINITCKQVDQKISNRPVGSLYLLLQFHPKWVKFIEISNTIPIDIASMLNLTKIKFSKKNTSETVKKMKMFLQHLYLFDPVNTLRS